MKQMNLPRLSRICVKRAYKICRPLAWLIATLLIFLIFSFIYLRIYGVPAPILSELIRRVNQRGIPVEVERLFLTLRGWKAEDVHYYTKDPDDMLPLFSAGEILIHFDKETPADPSIPSGRRIELDIQDLVTYPKKNWPVEIPEERKDWLRLNHLSASLLLSPRRTEISHLDTEWLGLRIHLSGLFSGTWQKPPKSKKIKLFLSEEQIELFAKKLENLTLPEGADVDLRFDVDLDQPLSSHAQFSARAKNTEIFDIPFSRTEIDGSFAYPEIKLSRCAIFYGTSPLIFSGGYHLDSRRIEGKLSSAISSPKFCRSVFNLLSFSPQKIDLQIEMIPRFFLTFPSTEISKFPGDFSGKFALRKLGYRGLTAESIAGNCQRKGKRIEVSDVRLHVQGQESRASEVGSAMRGGDVKGGAFWDANQHTFGVQAKGQIDPLLLYDPLTSISRIATNVIHRFRFKDTPPNLSVSLGADVRNIKKSFFIKVGFNATELSLQGVPLDMISGEADYYQKKLSITNIVAHQEDRSLTGSVDLDFGEKKAFFNGASTIAPADLEAIIHPKTKIFSEYVQFGKKNQYKGQGTVDWGKMQDTDFSGELMAKEVTLPHLGKLTHLTTKMQGKGAVISFLNTRFAYFGGHGGGTFSLILDPANKQYPYDTEFFLRDVDFSSFLASFGRKSTSKSPITLDGDIHVHADFSTNFFAKAEGKGFLRIEGDKMADLPFFSGFSKVMRKFFPGFQFLSINSTRASFTIKDGYFFSDDAYFGGELISARAVGKFYPTRGFDALVQVQTLNESTISKAIRLFTNPLTGLFKIKLTGPIDDVSWKLESFQRFNSKTEKDFSAPPLSQ